MLKLARHCCAVLCLVALHGLAWGGPIWVVVPNDSPIQTLTRQELADIYLDRNVVRSSLKAIPFDREEDTLRERFYLAIGISPSFMRSHWAKRVFTGRGRPPPMVSAAGLTAALSQGKTTLIYVEGAERPSNTRVVATLD
jgi:hypothetical protein